MSHRLRTKIYKKRYFALFAVAIALIVVWGATSFYQSNKRIIRKDKENELRAISNLKSNQISDWIQERGSDVRYFSQSKIVTREFELFVNKSADSKSRLGIEEILKLTKESHSYLDIQILSPQGEILFTFIDEKKLDSSLVPFHKKCVEEKKIVYTDLSYCKMHGMIHYDILSPLINDAGVVFAVILTRLNANDYLYPLIQRLPTASESAETLLLRKEGEYVLYLNNLRHRDSTALTFKIPLTETQLPAVQAANGYEGIFDGKDYRGVEVFADLRKIPNTNWFMVTKIDKAEMFSELRMLSIFTIVFSVSMILFVVAGLSAFV